MEKSTGYTYVHFSQLGTWMETLFYERHHELSGRDKIEKLVRQTIEQTNLASSEGFAWQTDLLANTVACVIVALGMAKGTERSRRQPILKLGNFPV